ncbi:BamA/TamA family outer membrane protein [Aquimarina sp. U1-2]|uniref:BamA/TamA family outer membrane protein n=1 Tax=Aquimarina sp. U1-2 TaxID=2823141 RepID=UPI001AED0C1B|nr:BamA/TamA family outer membrane protein [Aquimarina sp. U1-2]MBP2831112.1 BamA/TamA family outer membrane protein [Aquimarina sp. U1-2]
MTTSFKCKIVKFSLLCIFLPGSLLGQEVERLKEFFTFYPNQKAVAKDSSIYLSKFIAAPVVSYSPETDFGFGVGAKYLFKFKGSGEETRVSNMPITAQYTLNNQFFLFSGFEVFTNQEKWVIEGNLLFQNYPRIYYGIGSNTPESAEEQYDYTQFLFEPIFLKQLFTRYLFIGAGLRYNHIFNTTVKQGGLIDTNRPEGFDGSTSMGAEVAALYDSRDVILNAQKGWYMEFTHGEYFEILGGTHTFNLTRLDLRHFFKISERNNDVLAFQFVGRTVRDDQPFSEYSFFGSSEIMRGYQEGRFVDRDLLATQVEYRKRFGQSRWGAVAFVGAGDVYSNIDTFKFKNLKPNYGAGLRWMLDKSEHLNIRLDWGFGNGTNNLYLGIAEAF